MVAHAGLPAGVQQRTGKWPQWRTGLNLTGLHGSGRAGLVTRQAGAQLRPRFVRGRGAKVRAEHARAARTGQAIRESPYLLRRMARTFGTDQSTAKSREDLTGARETSGQGDPKSGLFNS